LRFSGFLRLDRNGPVTEDAMNQAENAARFARLHVKGAPLLLYNAWDAGSAKAILEAGGRAIATSSWSVAEAQGYRDGETIPIGLAEQIIGRIVATIDVPVTVDFEGGYSEDEGELSDNISRLLDLGVIGINFEDRIDSTMSSGRQAASPSFARRPSSSEWRSSSTRGPICFLPRAATRHSRLVKPSNEPRRTQPRAHPVSSFPAFETMR
jgi:hypothetical protein